jgi:hypothetical protein
MTAEGSGADLLGSRRAGTSLVAALRGSRIVFDGYDMAFSDGPSACLGSRSLVGLG